MIMPMRRPEGIAQMLSAQEDFKKQIEEAEQLRKDRFEQMQEERAETVEKGRQDMYDAYVDRYKILQQSPLYAPILPPMMSFEEFFSMKNQESKRPAMSPGVNEDVMADMMRRIDLNRMSRAGGGRIGFEEGSKDTVGNDIIQRKRANYFDLDRDTFMTMEQYLKSAQSDRDLDRKADGGRIGFREGKQVVKPVEIPAAPSELEVYTDYFEKQGMSRSDAEKAAEQYLFGPDSAMLNDSKKGLGELMRTARVDDEDEMTDRIDMLTDDASDMLKSDPMEMIKEAVETGRVAELDDSDIMAIYDAAVENGTFDGSFDDFKNMLSGMQRKPEGIMQTMVA